MNPPTPPIPPPSDPSGSAGADSGDPGAAGARPEGHPGLGQRLEHFYRSRKEAGDLQTTEIPISMLMAMDKLAKQGAESRMVPPTDLPDPPPGEGPEPIPGHPHAPERTGRDPQAVSELAGHLRRVAAYAKLLAQKLGMSEKEAHFVKQIAPMHDIGKWAIPESILQKPGSLSPEEWEIMKTHTSVGYELLKDSKLEVLRMGALVAVQHQEKFDGTGYPNGLKGEEIHIYSRITSVADVFDALGSERSYKQAWPVDDIIAYFRDGRGKHFDPMLVDLLLYNLPEFLEIRSSFT